MIDKLLVKEFLPVSFTYPTMHPNFGLKVINGYNKKPSREGKALKRYWVGESNSYCKIENLEY